jgi:polyketide-type polyunsaturated fatty acid synthase PfaA
MVNTRKIPDIDIAIVGMSSLFPEARTLGEFWENILSRKNCIREIVDKNLEEFDGYWRLDEYYSADTTAIDKTYGKIGGFIPEIEFDPIEYGIPPIHLESISTIQLFSLVLAKEALADANYSRQDSHQSLNRERTGVILGVGGCGNIAFTLATRTNIPQWEKVLRNLGYPDELVEVTLKKLTSLYAGWRESSFPGLLGNVVSGRISSYFDLGGTNCTLDAACASSLAAIKMAMAELADGSCDAVLTGGVNVDNSILAYMCFSKTPALSQEGFSRPFDATSDGIVLGDGIGMLVLKRLADAEAQGDKIYGVIRGIGSSSDGRAKSIYAPRFEGQIKALNRAYERAQVNPKEIQLIEAHGTGTIAGDLCEIKSISAVYQAEKVPNSSVAIGSIKSQIGHTRIAAGAASLIKVALGLYHKILPPTINVTKPHPQLSLDNSCFYINNEARPWIQPADGSKRRAGVSAFGFGGTNYHLIVEEYAREHQSAYRIHQLPEIFIVRADNLKILSQTCEVLAKKFSGDEGENHYRQYCNDHRHQPIPRQAARLGFVSESVEQAVEYLNIAVTLLSGDIPEAGQHPKGIYYRDGGLDPSGKVVALFPGQGSQYLNMGKDWANNYPDMREVIGECDHLFKQRNRPLLSQVIYPPTVFDQEGLDLLQKQLTKTENAQPAIGAISAGVYRILQKAGFQPDFILGHSFGEFTALWAGGVLNDRAFLELAIERGQAMQLSSQGAGAEGRMLAVNADEKGVQKWLASFPDVSITNYNSSNQTVLGGSEASIISLQKELSQAGFKATILPVANAFHTRFVDYAAQPLAGKIFQIEFGQPSVAIYSNVTARPYPHQPEAIKKILADHLRSPVAFRQSVEAIYSQGGRIFVEIGPKNILTNFVKDILKNKEHIAVALDFQSSKTQEYELRRAIVQLMVAGMAMEKFDPYQLPHQVKARKAKPSLSIKLNGGFYLNPDTKELRQKNLVEKDTLVWDSFLKSHREASFSSLDLAHQPQLVSGQEDFSGQYNEPEKELLTTDTKEVFFSPVPVGNSTKTETFANYQDKTMQNKGSQSITTMNNTTTLDRPLENMNILNDRVESQNFLSAVHQQFYQTQNQYLDLLSKIIEHQNTLSEKYKDTEVLHQGMQNFDRMLQLLQTNLQYVNDNHKYYLQSQLALLQGATIPVPTTPSFPSLQEINSTTTIPASGSEIDGKPNQELEVAKENINESPSLTPEPTIAPAPVKALELLVITPSSSKSPAAKKPTETTPENGEKAADSLQVTITNSVPSQSESVSFVATLTTDRVTSGITPIVEPVTIQVVTDAEAEAITNTLLKIVSEKTGYPVDMLDVNMELEADMGIDSIKQVEIIGAMRDLYPQIELDADTLDETWGNLRTLAQVSDYIKNLIASADAISGIARQEVKKNS